MCHCLTFQCQPGIELRMFALPQTGLLIVKGLFVEISGIGPEIFTLKPRGFANGRRLSPRPGN
ncbi:hypothetical protein GCM10011503_00830 [Henriciella pelagia]|uniref:Uncharacterized protein n=1 Tax=Henriciella pelagia TaxID=1977912 RepID=A0ABQ1J2M6_9PROT|nr:hypothetical protein GCM10011503_00830 [Henriciella pelagia]